MHELSLCHSIYTIVDRERHGRSVSTVHLQVGRLRQVVPKTLEYCWGLVTEGTPLAGCQLAIEAIPIAVRCRACSTASKVERLCLACPRCASAAVDVIAGEEFLLTTIDVERTTDGTLSPTR